MNRNLSLVLSTLYQIFLSQSNKECLGRQRMQHACETEMHTDFPKKKKTDEK
jgi:hypothetical protein